MSRRIIEKRFARMEDREVRIDAAMDLTVATGHPDMHGRLPNWYQIST